MCGNGTETELLTETDPEVILKKYDTITQKRNVYWKRLTFRSFFSMFSVIYIPFRFLV